MDREIKFRGKRIDNNEWVYGGYFKDGEKYLIVTGEGSKLRAYEVILETVGQYTGIKENKRESNDKKEIYFGDMVKCYGGEYCQGTWEYSEIIIVTSFYNCVDIAESEYVEIVANIPITCKLLIL